MARTTLGSSRSDIPNGRDMTVTCSPYYRMRADVQRSMKNLPPVISVNKNTSRISTALVWREMNNLTVEDLARNADISIEEVASIEGGSTDAPLTTYIKIAKALRINVAKLLDLDRNSNS
ncbi:helix-turn-helix domain-containing protein [Labrys neptuniae]